MEADSRADGTDDELVKAAGRGDMAALETLLLRYQPHLYRFGLSMCGNEEDAGDIAQESLIAMARSLKDFRGDASVSSWLYAIARSFCIKKRRRSKFAPARMDSLDAPDSTVADRLADPALNPEQAATNQELSAGLTRAIDALDADQREVLVLRDVEGLPALEVARVVGISVEAVKSRLHRARIAVRHELGPLLGSPAIDTPREPMCPDVLTLFSQHLEGEIDAGVCAALEAHLAQCDRCRHACESLRRTLAVCRKAPLPELPAALAASVRAAIRDVIRRR